MASSILNSDDGVISGTSGLKSTGGDDGVLVFQSKGTETARINTDKQIVAAAGTASLPIYSTTGDTNTGIFFPAADTIAFAEGGAEAMRINSSSEVLVGTTTTTNNLRLNQKLALVNVSTFGGASFTSYGGANSSSPLILDFQKSRGTSDGSMTVVASGDQLGSVVFRGSDGTSFQDAAVIGGEVDGTPGAGDMPGRLVFKTTADGASSATERMRIDSSGNLGLGVTPSAWTSTFKVLEIPNGGSMGAFSTTPVVYLNSNAFFNGANWIYKTTAPSVRYQLNANTGTHDWFTAPSGTAGNTISFTQAMTLNASGNLLVGDTSTAAGEFLRVVGSVGNHIARFVNTKATTLLYGPLIQYSIASPNDTGNEFLTCTDNTTLRMTVRSNGGIANYTANDVNLSDRREKTNFAPAKSYLQTICAIPVQTFNYIDQNHEEDPGLTLGVVAQDVQEVAPELVSESNWGTKEKPKMRLSIYQTDLQYALMKSIQELKAELDTVKAELATLKGN